MKDQRVTFWKLPINQNSKLPYKKYGWCLTDVLIVMCSSHRTVLLYCIAALALIHSFHVIFVILSSCRIKGCYLRQSGSENKKMGKLIIFITWDFTIFLILVLLTNYFHQPYLDYNYVIKIPRAFYSIPSFLHASRRFPWWLIWASFSDQIELKTLPWAQKSKSGKKKKNLYGNNSVISIW